MQRELSDNATEVLLNLLGSEAGRNHLNSLKHEMLDNLINALESCLILIHEANKHDPETQAQFLFWKIGWRSWRQLTLTSVWFFLFLNIESNH